MRRRLPLLLWPSRSCCSGAGRSCRGRTGSERTRTCSSTVAEALGGTAGGGFARADRAPPLPLSRRPRPPPGVPHRVVVLHRQPADGPGAGGSATSSPSSASPSRPAPCRGARAGRRTRSTWPTSPSPTWQEERFHYAERFSRAALGLAGARRRRSRCGSRTGRRGDRRRILRACGLRPRDGDVAIDLRPASLKPVVPAGRPGAEPQRERRRATPRTTTRCPGWPPAAPSGSAGRPSRSSGLSWLDREWGTSALEEEQAGWDWFALQLDDGRDLMFYRLRREDGSTDPFSSGTLVAADGTSRRLSLDDVRLETLRLVAEPGERRPLSRPAGGCGSREDSTWKSSRGSRTRSCGPPSATGKGR